MYTDNAGHPCGGTATLGNRKHCFVERYRACFVSTECLGLQQTHHTAVRDLLHRGVRETTLGIGLSGTLADPGKHAFYGLQHGGYRSLVTDS